MLEQLGKGTELIEKVSGSIEKLRTLGISLSQLILLGIGGWAYRFYPDWVKSHWKPVLLVCVVYELFFFVAWITKPIWWFLGKVLAGVQDRLENQTVGATVDWLFALPSRYSPGFRRRYYKAVRLDHEIFNVRGLESGAAHTLKLEHVFVDLKISTSNKPKEPKTDLIAPREFAQARSLWDFIRASKGESSDAIAIVIIGPPGCGKTTLLQHIAITLAANQQLRYRLRAFAPLLLSLREHVTAVTDNPSMTLGQLAHRHFSDQGKFRKLRPPSDWFERELSRGRCVVLLDGLDEVARADKREEMSRWIDKQLLNYPRSRLVVTSRPKGYEAAPLDRVHLVEVQSFNNEQVKAFVHNWYLANETVSFGNQVDEGVRRRATQDAEALLERLRKPESRALLDLTVNPLLLTMIAMVQRYRGALPGNRVELYSEICTVLLGRWRRAKGVPDAMNVDQKLVVLMPLAASMMAGNIREIGVDVALDLIASLLERVGIQRGEGETFLKDLEAGSGLFLDRGAGKWGFAHLTFQEYLTAAHWVAEKAVPQDWASLVNNPWWHETLRLYAAKGDATAILQACLAAASIQAMTLAAEIMQEGPREASPEVRRAVDERLYGAFESDDPELRKLAAEVYLARRLSLTHSSSFHRLDDEHEIDMEFITCAEYQLFLDEMYARKSYHQPDHWKALSFPDGDALKPVSGIRSKDAMAFCEWLTERHGGGVRFRLPQTGEAVQAPVKQAKVAAWCRDGASLALTPLESSLEKEIAARLQQLSIEPSLQVFIDGEDKMAGDDNGARARARARDLARDLALDRDRARDLSHALDLAHARDLAHDLARARDLARDLAHAHARDLDLDLARDLDLDLARARARARDLSLVSVLARARARDLDLVFPLARDRADTLLTIIDIIIAVEQAIAFVLVNAIKFGLDRDHDFSLRLNPFRPDSEKDDRLKNRKRSVELLETACRNFEILHISQPRTGWRRWFRFRAEPEPTKQLLLQALRSLQIIIAREEGKLPAWEGIRLVREQVRDSV